MSQGVNDAASQLGRLGSAAQKAASDVGVLKTLSIGRAFVDGIQSVYSTFSNFAQGTFNAVESTSNLSRELGISYEQLTQLQMAAGLAGVSTESLAKAFTKAQVTISKAAGGGKEAVQALSSIGLSAKDFQGLSSSEQFSLIANAINGITDPAQRAAAAVAIFGKSGAELLPAFRELGGNIKAAQENLAKFGGGITDKEAEAVNKLGDTFTFVAKDIEIVSTKLLAQLAPALTDATNKFIDFLASLDIAQVASVAAGVIQAIGDALTIAYNVASALSPVFSAIGDAIAFVSENGRGAAIGIGSVATALGIYKTAAIASSIATRGIGVAVRTLLASTGIGLLVTVFGAIAGAAVEWGLSSADAGNKAKKGVAGVADATQSALVSAQALGQSSSGAIKGTFAVADEAAKKAAEQAAKASEAARREADAAIQRLVTDQQFGGDSQRFAAAQAVKSIEEDIRRTEEELAAARKVGDQDAIDAAAKRIGLLDQAKAREEDIASGAAKAAKERLKLETEYAKVRSEFDAKRLAALAKPSTELLQLEDTRTASGYAALQRFSNDQADDPALQEYRKQLKELVKIRQAIAKTEDIGTVDILGA